MTDVADGKANSRIRVCHGGRCDRRPRQGGRLRCVADIDRLHNGAQHVPDRWRGVHLHGFLGSLELHRPEENKIGAENIGFLQFPAVEVARDPPTKRRRMSTPPWRCVSRGSEARDWVKCIAANYGTVALRTTARSPGSPWVGPSAALTKSCRTRSQIPKTSPVVRGVLPRRGHDDEPERRWSARFRPAQR